MSGASPLWRGILWAERYLPTPPAPPAEPSAAAKRRAALVTQLVLLGVTLPAVLRHRREMEAVLVHDAAMFAQVAVILAAGALVAAVAFGARAWRDVRGVR